MKITFIEGLLHLKCPEYTEETAEEVSKMRQHSHRVRHESIPSIITPLFLGGEGGGRN